MMATGATVSGLYSHIAHLVDKEEGEIPQPFKVLNPNKLNTTEQGPVTSGESTRNKRVIPVLAIIQGVAAMGGMMIKGDKCISRC